MLKDAKQDLTTFGGVHNAYLCVAESAEGLGTHFHQGFFEVGELLGHIVGTAAMVCKLWMSIMISLLVDDGHFVGLLSQTVGNIGYLLHGMDESVFIVAHTDEQNLGTHMT